MASGFDILGFSHIGFAVWSIEDFQNSWGQALGMEDWLVKDSAAPGGFQLHGHVVEGETKARTAFGKIGGTCIELIQPVMNEIHHKEHLDTVGPGVHHIAFWVRDLKKQIERTEAMGWEVAYSPTSLRPGLADRQVSATTAGQGWDHTLEYPPFFSFVEERDRNIKCTIELIDADYARQYHDEYGDYTYYPGDLPV